MISPWDSDDSIDLKKAYHGELENLFSHAYTKEIDLTLDRHE
jgi:hypothetical protein